MGKIIRLVKIEEPAAPKPVITDATEITAKDIKNNSSSKPRDRVFITPLARRIAEQQGIDINLVKGTGPHGRIIKKDLANIKSTSSGKVLQKPDVITAKMYLQIHQIVFLMMRSWKFTQIEILQK